MTEIADALLAAIADLKATLERRLASVDDRLTALEAAVGVVKAELVPMRAQVNGMANVDFGFLQAAAQRQLQDARAAREFQSRVDIKLDEIFGSMATAPEIRKLREEVAESIAQQSEMELRISALESRLGVKNPLHP